MYFIWNKSLYNCDRFLPGYPLILRDSTASNVFYDILIPSQLIVRIYGKLICKFFPNGLYKVFSYTHGLA
jgi:hypothetical protein